MTRYDRYDDTPFFWEHPEISDRLKRVLTDLLHSQVRVRIFSGDTESGLDWEEEFDVMGYIGRTTGQHKIPILVNNSRSWGGPAILTNCIVKITRAVGGDVIWEHPNYHHAAHSIQPCNVQWNDQTLIEAVLKDGQVVAQFSKPGQAAIWIDFIEGRRNNKG